MRKIGAAAVALLLALSLCGCGRYASHYKAVGFVHSNTAESAYMSFFSFEGRMVFRLKSDGGETLRYTAKLETGSASVYADWIGEKRELLSVGAGDDCGDAVTTDAGTVYIIVETDGPCKNGDFRFSIEEPTE